MLQGMVGHYHVLALRGTGGMGAVYKAVDTRLNRPVALKIINPQHIQDPEAVRRLRREALAAASLDHPSICKVYELLEQDQQTVLVMEYVDGETLAERLARGPLPLTEVLRTAAEVAEALAEAHERGLVHRDIKPSNIMITSRGHVKVLDFGIAGFVSPRTDTGLQAATTQHVGVGTLRYMAPEQVTSNVADTRSDIFSLGVVIYESLTGRLPFVGSSGLEYLDAVARRTPTPVAQVEPRIPRAVERVVMRCLEKDPQKRFQSAVDLHATLTDLGEDTASGKLERDRPVPIGVGRILAATGVVAVIAVAAWLAVGFVTPTAPSVLEPDKVRQLTTSGAERGSRISPDSQWLSYVSDDDGQSILRQGPLADPRAPQNQIITATPGSVLSHAWSPDSNEIAYLRDVGDVLYLEKIPRTGSREPRASWLLAGMAPAQTHLVRWATNGIYVESDGRLLRVDSVSGEVKPVEIPARAHPDKARDFDIDPDGGHLLFSSASGAIFRHLFYLDLQSGISTQLTHDQLTDQHPIWLRRGGRLLAFQSNRDGQTDLWQMDRVTRVTGRITTDRGDEIPNDATGDGSVLVYELCDDTSQLYQLAPVDADLAPLTQENVSDTWPSVARELPALAFQRSGPVRRLGYEFLDTEIYLMPEGKAGTSVNFITMGYGPVISPDGHWLAFLRQDPAEARRTQLLLRTPQKQIRLLSNRFDNPGVWGASAPTPFEQTAVNLAWSPDSSRLFFVESHSESPKTWRVVAYEMGTERSAVVFEDPARMFDIRPSHDGRRVAFLRLPRNAGGCRSFEIVVMGSAPGAEQVWHRGDLGDTGSVRLLGWQEDEAHLVFLKLSPNSDQTQGVEVLKIAANGAEVRVGALLDRAWACTARLDPTGSHLYILARGERSHRFLTMPTDGGAWREVRTTGSTRVVFEGFVFTASGEAVFAQHKRTQDIRGVWFKARR